MTIYMNGEPTLFENIFDAVNPTRPDLWHTVQESEVGRPYSDILSDWVNNHRTYYYLHGVKTVFELRQKIA